MPHCGQADKHALLQKVVFLPFLVTSWNSFREVDCVYVRKPCLGFTCQVRKEVCACECVLIAVLFMHISRYRYPGQVEQSTLIV